MWNYGQPEEEGGKGDEDEEEVLSRPRQFFLHEWKFLLYVFVLSMVLRLDAEHIEN